MRNDIRTVICACAVFAIAIGVFASGSWAAEQRAESDAAVPIERLFSKFGEIPLGDATNRMDYQSVDPQTRRLYVAKMGAGELLALDLDTNRLSARFEGFPKITGVLAVPALHRVYASVPGAGILPSISVALGMAGLSSGRGAVAILDSANFREVARLPGGVFPDGIAYDAKDHKVFVSDELGAAVMVYDANSNRFAARIDTGGEVGNVQYDPVTAKIYAPIQSNNELAVIDPQTSRIAHRFPLPGGTHPHGLAVAPGSSFGYVACDEDDRLLTINLATGRVVRNQPVAHDPDVLAIDTTAKRLYVASESGRLSVFDITSPGAPIALGDVFIADGAHSVAIDPVTHRVYLPLASKNGRAILIVLTPKFYESR